MTRLERENNKLRKHIQWLESGSRQSMLNCHREGKKNMQLYINTFYPGLKSPGNFIRRVIEQTEPYSYEEIIAGEF
jgi:hypothetical protein